MDPITWVVVAVLVGTGAGFGAGWGLRGDRDNKALEIHAQSLDHLLDGQTELLTAASQPVILDASIREDLAKTPPQCRRDLGGDPMTPACAWATCIQYGQSSAQRPECREVEAAMLLRFQTPTSGPVQE
tara:strand:+ start:90 stop:476 length:387 start_codon:yes stop_codon:yes gene_type:complete